MAYLSSNYPNYYAGVPTRQFLPGQIQPDPTPPQQPQQFNYVPTVKGRFVTSFDEVKAAQIDFDGSLFTFPDIGNQRIYTKQINLDGTVTINTYSLTENEENTCSYITKQEFDNTVNNLQEIINSLTQKIEDNSKSIQKTNAQPAINF